MQAATATQTIGNVTPISSGTAGGALALPAEDRKALALKVMGESLYPGAKPESVVMAYEYCQAQGLDPLMKPVHIMQVSVKTAGPNGKDIYDKRDVILPGIGLYRTMAARTGTYAGMTEPEFGPNEVLGYKRAYWEEGPNGRDVKKTRDEEIAFPSWCKITVRRIVAGVICDFTATEYWLENYATAGRNTDAPNEMWRKRVRGQLAKVAESQALRKAFPEVGAVPTMEEMEGKIIDLPAYNSTPRDEHDEGATEEGARRAAPMPRRKSDKPEVKPEPVAEAPKHDATDVPFTESDGEPPCHNPVQAPDQPARRAAPAASQRATEPSPPATPGMLGLLRVKAGQRGLTEADLIKHAGVDALENLTIAQGNALLIWMNPPKSKE